LVADCTVHPGHYIGGAAVGATNHGKGTTRTNTEERRDTEVHGGGDEGAGEEEMEKVEWSRLAAAVRRWPEG
jgi:hypothetical protein